MQKTKENGKVFCSNSSSDNTTILCNSSSGGSGGERYRTHNEKKSIIAYNFESTYSSHSLVVGSFLLLHFAEEFRLSSVRKWNESTMKCNAKFLCRSLLFDVVIDGNGYMCSRQERVMVWIECKRTIRSEKYSWNCMHAVMNLNRAHSLTTTLLFEMLSPDQCNKYV